MMTNQVYDRERSLLGFGTMRLPVKEDGSIDEEAVFEMVRYAEEHGVNYYEEEILMQIAGTMKNSLPCTSCRYCCDGCPKGIDIPKMIGYYNEMKFAPSFNVGMAMDAVEKNHHPSACVKCGKCKQREEEAKKICILRLCPKKE